MGKVPTCPWCGGHRFELTIAQQVDVEFADGFYPDDALEAEVEHEVLDGPRGDLEWDDDTSAICGDGGSCGWSGKLKETTA